MDDKYGALKRSLTQRLLASQEQRTRQLLEHEELDDRKPSSTIPEASTRPSREYGARQPFADIMVTFIRANASNSSNKADRLEDIAEQVDKIHEANGAVTETGSTDRKSLEDKGK